MSTIKDLQENIVSAESQNLLNLYTYGNNKGIRILFVGNSIAKHRPKPEIKWYNDCGMAASSVDKDYVHLLVEKFKGMFGEDISFAICPIAAYERQLDVNLLEKFNDAKDYNADIVIMFFGANVPSKLLENNVRYTEPENIEKFKIIYEALRNHLCKENAIVFHSDGFYIKPELDAVKKLIAQKYGDTYINIEDIREKEESHGRFNHPSDYGMAEIANRFWSVIKPKLEEHI